MYKLIHVRACTFWFLRFYIAYTTLNKLLAVIFFINTTIILDNYSFLFILILGMLRTTFLAADMLWVAIEYLNKLNNNNNNYQINVYIEYIVYNLITYYLCCWCWTYTTLFPIGHYACQFIVYYTDCILIGCYQNQSFYSYDLAGCTIRENSSQLEGLL